LQLAEKTAESGKWKEKTKADFRCPISDVRKNKKAKTKEKSRKAFESMLLYLPQTARCKMKKA